MCRAHTLCEWNVRVMIFRRWQKDYENKNTLETHARGMAHLAHIIHPLFELSMISARENALQPDSHTSITSHVNQVRLVSLWQSLGTNVLQMALLQFVNVVNTQLEYPDMLLLLQCTRSLHAPDTLHLTVFRSASSLFQSEQAKSPRKNELRHCACSRNRTQMDAGSTVLQQQQHLRLVDGHLDVVMHAESQTCANKVR